MSKSALIKEIGRLSYLVSLTPTQKELSKGIRNKEGVEIDKGISRIDVKAELDEESDSEAAVSNDEVGEGQASADTGPPRVEVTPASTDRGRDECPASSTEGADHVPFHLRPEVQLRSKGELLASSSSDPTSGFPRPMILQRGCKLFNTKSGLARAWSLPPHIQGGQKIA